MSLRGENGLVDFEVNGTVLQLVYPFDHYLPNLLLFLQFHEVVLLTVLLYQTVYHAQVAYVLLDGLSDFRLE